MAERVDVFRDGDGARGVAEATGARTASEVCGYEECIRLEADIGDRSYVGFVCGVE